MQRPAKSFEERIVQDGAHADTHFRARPFPMRGKDHNGLPRSHPAAPQGMARKQMEGRFKHRVASGMRSPQQAGRRACEGQQFEARLSKLPCQDTRKGRAPVSDIGGRFEK